MCKSCTVQPTVLLHWWVCLRGANPLLEDLSPASAGLFLCAPRSDWWRMRRGAHVHGQRISHVRARLPSVGRQGSDRRAHDLTVDQAGPHLEVVHGLDHERVAGRPVVAPAGNQPDAHRVTTSHEPKPIVLDLVNPVRPGRGIVGRRGETGLDELGVGGQAPAHTLKQHATNVGGRSRGSNRFANVGNEQMELLLSRQARLSCAPPAPDCRARAPLVPPAGLALSAEGSAMTYARSSSG